MVSRATQAPDPLTTHTMLAVPELLSPYISYAGQVTITRHNTLLFGGASALAYDSSSGTYFVGCEEIWKSRAEWAPRFYEVNLTFSDRDGHGSYDLLRRVYVPEAEGLKIEAAAMNPSTGSLWLASEMNSGNQIDVVGESSSFLTRGFGFKDVGVQSNPTPSRIVRVSRKSGNVTNEAALPAWTTSHGAWKWDQKHCVGTRHLGGLQGFGFAPDGTVAVAANQNAFFRDGGVPTTASGSAIRFLFFDVTGDNITFSHAHRYESSRILLRASTAGSNKHSAVVGVLPLSRTEALVLEQQEASDMGAPDGRSSLSMLFLVHFPADESVDSCASLQDCTIPTPPKRLLFRSEGVADDLTFGPPVRNDDGTTDVSVVICYDSDFVTDTHFVRLTVNTGALRSLAVTAPMPGQTYANNDAGISDTLKMRRGILLGGAVVLLALFGSSLVLRKLYGKKLEEAKLTDLNSRKYILYSACANSFLLGGVVFGYSSAVLMFRAQGIYSEGCACSKYCTQQKEAFALVSTLGFAANVGSRIIWGRCLDRFGPKITSCITGLLTTIGIVMMVVTAATSESDTFLPGWVLMASGGGGMHVAGFHTSNLFGVRKKAASALLSASFGAGSIIFPLLQMYSQFGGWELTPILVAYACVAAALTLNSCVASPWRTCKPKTPWQPVRSPHTAAFWAGLRPALYSGTVSAASASAAAKSSTQTTVPVNVPPPTDLCSLVWTVAFWAEALHFSVNYLLNTVYLSALNEIMCGCHLRPWPVPPSQLIMRCPLLSDRYL